MKNSLNKLIFLSMMVSTFMIGCSRTLSHGITDEGHVDRSNLVFPEFDQAWQKNGQFPNYENLTKIKLGITKDELYYLLGRPHFREAQNAKEWDYIMKFYQKDGSIKICQFKIIFDKQYKGREFYWLPTDCQKYINGPEKQVIVKQVNVPVSTKKAPQVIHKKMSLDADALFRFNESNLDNMLPLGRAQLDQLASKLRSYSQSGNVQIKLSGHTDYKGSEEYNLALSQRRANTVLGYLAQRGINPATMSASGLGESFPVKQCSSNLPRQQEIDCLQPNRRVDVDVLIYQYNTQ